MNRTKAIASKCLECSGGSSKEVTLCHIFDCPLWPFRFGTANLNTQRFNARMNRIKTDYSAEYSWMCENLADYVQNTPNSRVKTYILRFLGANTRKGIS